MKKRTNKLKSNLEKFTLTEGNQPSLWVSAFFLVTVFLFASCSPELQEQASLVEKENRLPEVNFEKWYESENREIQAPKSNARMKFEPSVQLTYRYKEVDWSSYKKLNIPSKLAIYEFDFLAPNLVVPFDFKEEFGYEEALKRSKQTLLIYAQGNEVVKAYVVRYYFSGEKEWIADFQKVNYDAIDKNWKGQIDLYSLNEIHLVSFDMVIGQVIGTETMKLGSQDDLHPSQSANTTCTTIWTPGPCEPLPGETGVVCYDTFTTYCYNSSPPLISGFPFWNGSGGFAPGGTGEPAVQSICDFDPTCIPHPGSLEEMETLIQNFIEGLTDPEQRRKAQLDYLRNRGGSDLVELVEELINAGGLSMGDIREINKLVESVYLNQKARFLMVIFSPENFNAILFLVSSDISTTLRTRVFNFLPNYAFRQGVNILIPLGKGSTGRVVARNIEEQLAMKAAMANPEKGFILPVIINDSRWLGWTKMQFKLDGLDGSIIIHYVGKWENGVLLYIDDFKFITP